MIKRSRNIFLVTTILAGTAYAMPAVAQETGGAVASQTTGQTAGAQPDQTAAASTDIVVTGSRIARPDLQASVPVVTIGAERIQDTGASNIQDVLATLPAVGQNVSRTSSNFSNTGNGVATVNLRNLGASRTLVLIDGRRSLGIAGSSAVDVNNIPTDLIERVEVVTGGASAVYGSEAVAGVVNFVLNRKFEGRRVRAQNTISDKGDAPRQYVSITAGHGFADDRGHVACDSRTPGAGVSRPVTRRPAPPCAAPDAATHLLLLQLALLAVHRGPVDLRPLSGQENRVLAFLARG